MKVTVELTDDQADRIGNGRPGCESESMLRDAIVAARTKPLKVGDKVVHVNAKSRQLDIAGWGTHHSGAPYLVVLDSGRGRLIETFLVDEWSMADGSPIVWPES